MAKNLQSVLEVKNLVKKFPSSVKTSEGKGEFVAVDGVSFSMEEGQILGFLGPNGAGKSTTINCLLGIIKPEEGTIKIFGKELFSARSEILQNVNYCSAEYNLPWNLTLYESLLVFAQIYQVGDASARIEELLSEFEIWDLRKTFVRNLSFGQRARGNLCRALLNRPKLLLLDEPMSSMDPDVVDKGIKRLLAIKKENNMSILYTSHNMWEIEQVADKVIFINHGKVIAHGTPLELTQQELKLGAKEPDMREVFIHLSRQAPKEAEKEQNES